jgi:HK97 family phage portal protein
MPIPFLSAAPRRSAKAPARAEEAKASRIGRLLAFPYAGKPVWTPRDYAALAREGFMQNAIVYRAVRMIAEAAASVPWLLYDGAAEVDDHPLLTLLAQPNRRQAGADFREAVVGYLLTAGNAYIEAVAVDGVPRELYALRPDRMKVVPGPDGWPEAYEYTVAGQTVRFTDPGDGELAPILQLTLFHPLDDHYGFAPVEAAAYALDTHNAAAAWNKALLDNSARPSGALVYSAKDGGNLSSEQYERLKGELETGFTGAARAGRPLLLEGGLDWKTMSLSPKDMDFLEAKNAAAREVALAFGVPPMLLGIPGDNTYANYKEANAAFWRGTVLPLAAKIAGALSEWLVPAFGNDLRLWFDPDQVDALSGDREALWARVASADFLTVNEKRAAVGYGAIDGGDVLGAAALSAKYGFDPNQPRVPSGTADGGQWTATGGGGDAGAGGGSSARVSAAGAGVSSAESSATRLAGNVVRICMSIGEDHETRDMYGNIIQFKSSYLCANGEVVVHISKIRPGAFIRDPYPYP